MQCMTVEPFTSPVIVAKVTMSRLARDALGADAVDSGEGDSVGSQRQEQPVCRDQTLTDGRSCAAKAEEQDQTPKI